MSLFPYENEIEPAALSMETSRLDRVVSEFRNQQARGVFPGGQLVLRRKGKLILNEVCGIGRGWRREEGIEPVEVKPNTPFPVLSAGKPLAAVAVAMLEDRGILSVDAPVAELVPGFSRHGKSKITILDVLTHRTGIMLPKLVENRFLWQDRETILDQLVNAKPVYPRGTLMYAAYEYGWILSEVFLQAVQCSLPDFIAQEISTPLNLPALRLGLAGRDLASLAYNYWLGRDKVIVSGINVAKDFEEKNNSIEQIESLNPAVSLVTDAASLAVFYEFLVNGGVTLSGERLISQEVIEKYITVNVYGFDRSSRFPSRLGRGFMLGSRLPSLFGWWGTETCFGHVGGFSSLAFGDLENKIAVGIVTNGNRNFIDLMRRFLPLTEKLRKACM